MKKIAATLIVTLSGILAVSNAAHAVYRPGWDRPFLKAEMEILDARNFYTSVTDVTLTLTRRDGSDVEGLALEYRVAGDETKGESDIRSEFIEINEASADECGSVHYFASSYEEHPHHGARFSIHLVDHSARFCEDLRPYLWEASVRSGFGWCGTMDATLELGGYPGPVFTVMTH